MPAYMKGVLLHSATVATASQTGSKYLQVPQEGAGLALLHVKIAAGASDTLKVKVQGRLNSAMGWVDLKKQDYSTEASVAQAAGAATEAIIPVAITPEIRLDFSGTISGARQVDVYLLAPVTAARTDA